MTLAQQMVDDMDSVFLNTDDFAETVTYTPLGGSGQSIKGILTRRESLARLQTSLGIAIKGDAALFLETHATRGVESPTNGDKVKDSNGDVWTVIGQPIKAHGGQVLDLGSFVDKEFHSVGDRVRVG